VSFFIFILLLSVSNGKMFQRVPFVGDDIFRTVFPNMLNICNRPSMEDVGMENMLEYIKQHTPQDAVFFGDQIIRSATGRSVVMDNKGASIIIEANPKQFVKWYLDKEEYRKLQGQDSKIEFLKKKNVSYIVVNGENFNS